MTKTTIALHKNGPTYVVQAKELPIKKILNLYLSCIIQDDASIRCSRPKKVKLHRRKLDMVDRVNSPLEGAGRHTEDAES